MIAKLKDNFRVIAPDYPGFGLSPTPLNYDFLPSTHSKIINAFIDQLELNDIIPVIQDWGGPIGLNIATRTHQGNGHWKYLGLASRGVWC